MNSKITTLLLMSLFSVIFIGMACASSNLITSTVSSQTTTTVPLVYRAVVGIILIIIAIFAIWKFFKLFIGAIFAFIILAIILSTTYYFFITGAFSIHNSLAFLEYIWHFFSGRMTTIHTISKTVNSINNISGKINNVTNVTTNTVTK